MNGATLSLVLQGLTALVTAAPQVEALVKQVKDLIAAMFTAKQITKAQQDAMMAQVDAIVSLSQAGIVPAHWQVQPDPQ
jgi:predicted RNA-binding protein associated with RNAse of E/G family